MILHWYGAEFSRGYAPLAILSVGALLTVPVGSLTGFLLTMTGHERQAAIVVCGTALLNLLLTLILTPTLGIAGTALATVAAGIVRAGIFTVYIRRRLHLSLVPFRFARHVVS
jgi:O-antigen/teichoic acid export membrane protein